MSRSRGTGAARKVSGTVTCSVLSDPLVAATAVIRQGLMILLMAVLVLLCGVATEIYGRGAMSTVSSRPLVVAAFHGMISLLLPSRVHSLLTLALAASAYLDRQKTCLYPRNFKAGTQFTITCTRAFLARCYRHHFAFR